MSHHFSRRDFLRTVSIAAGVSALGLSSRSPLRAAEPPTSPVSIVRCKTFDVETLVQNMTTMTDQLGGLKKSVEGKTVAVKLNMTGSKRGEKIEGLPAGRTFQTHFNTALATAIVLDKAGAKRIRFLEGLYENRPLEHLLKDLEWDLNKFSALKATVEFEDTHNMGKGTKYHEVKVPWGGSLFPAYHLNHSYVECDFYVSLAKMKNHAAAGITMASKNNFGITPTALYGQSNQDEKSASNRVAVFHKGEAKPMAGLPQELPNMPREASSRVPRHAVDANGIRPIDLAIIDGIESVSGGEGPWVGKLTPQQPGVLVMGRNSICTDAIGTAIMGYDPMAKPRTGPFPGDNHLAIAAEAGVGTNDPKKIEVVGVALKDVIHPYNWEPASRGT